MRSDFMLGHNEVWQDFVCKSKKEEVLAINVRC